MKDPHADKTTPKDESLCLEKYGSRKYYRMPTCFDKSTFRSGQQFHFRITQIYDPSKFWIVTKHNELECFQKYMFRWYYMNRSNFKISVNELEKEMYCVVFIDGGYYRGIVAGFPCDAQKEQEVQIYFIDYGMLRVVSVDNIYYMNSKCAQVPQFAVRASLAGICPKRAHQWSEEDVAEFYNLVVNKILLGVVVNVDCERQVLELHFSEVKDGIMTIPVHKILLAQKRARNFHKQPKIVENKFLYQPKLKYPYLFPSHEALESGKIPLSVSDAVYQLQIGSPSSIISRYYNSKGISNEQLLES